MINKLQTVHSDHKPLQKPLQNQQKMIQQPLKQPIVIQNKTFSQFRQELKEVEQKIKNLQTKRYSSKENEWENLNRQINEILASLKLKKLRKVFERKFEEQIRLLNDFYTKRYHQSMFQFCFFCCPTFILRKLKYYKFIDNVFEKTISDVQKTQRNVYFYVNLLYIKLFIMMVAVEDRLKEQFNKKMIEALTVQSKQEKVIQTRKKQVGELEEINDVFVMEEQNFKNLDDENKIVASYIIESDNPNQVKGKTEPREPLDTSLMKQNYYDEFKKVRTEIQTIISNDWKDIINCQEWSSRSYFGFIQINSEPPISTFLEFKDCKMKTNHLFGEISSSSFDLRTYLVKKSRHAFHKYQYVLNSLNEDSVDFQLTFWLSESQRTDKNHESIEKFLLLAMRIGIKQKIYRTCNMHYKEVTKKWMIHNYVHMSYKENNNTEVNVNNNNVIVESETSYKSLSESSQKMSPEMFWWVNLGEALVRAIVEVANERKVQRKQYYMKKKQSNKRSKASSQWDNNPESIDRLVKPPNLNKKNYHSANQV